MFEIDSPFTMIVLLVIIGVGGGVINNWLKIKRESVSAVGSGEVDSLRREVADLRERVKTLERIATDTEHNLSREIERLYPRQSYTASNSRCARGSPCKYADCLFMTYAQESWLSGSPKAAEPPQPEWPQLFGFGP